MPIASVVILVYHICMTRVMTCRDSVTVVDGVPTVP